MNPEQREWYQKGIESIISRCPYCGLSLGKVAGSNKWGNTCLKEPCVTRHKSVAGRKSASKGGNYRKW